METPESLGCNIYPCIHSAEFLNLKIGCGVEENAFKFPTHILILNALKLVPTDPEATILSKKLSGWLFTSPRLKVRGTVSV